MLFVVKTYPLNVISHKLRGLNECDHGVYLRLSVLIFQRLAATDVSSCYFAAFEGSIQPKTLRTSLQI
jgi:hypothetical protein